MRMDRPNGVHNEERTFLDRITQLKSILKNRCGGGRWSCHLDGAVLAGRSAKRTLNLAAREETAKARLFHKI